MNILNILKSNNVKLNELKRNHSYFLVTETIGGGKINEGKLVLVEDGSLTFETSERSFKRISASDYNLFETSNGNRSCIFGNIEDAFDYQEFLEVTAPKQLI